MAPRSNLKQCIRLLASRLESTTELIALKLVMKDEVLQTRHSLLSLYLRSLHVLHQNYLFEEFKYRRITGCSKGVSRMDQNDDQSNCPFV